jgi:hypothetical protein
VVDFTAKSDTADGSRYEKDPGSGGLTGEGANPGRDLKGLLEVLVQFELVYWVVVNNQLQQ